MGMSGLRRLKVAARSLSLSLSLSLFLCVRVCVCVCVVLFLFSSFCFGFRVGWRVGLGDAVSLGNSSCSVSIRRVLFVGILAACCINPHAFGSARMKTLVLLG